MAKKDTTGRLTIPKDIWETSNLCNGQSYGFYIIDDSRVIITDTMIGESFEYQFLGKCVFDNKHRFVVPKNVDTYLGMGDTYYFSTSSHQSSIFIYKLDLSSMPAHQSAQISKLLSSI